MNERQRRALTFLGLTAIFVGYFMAWLDHSAAGLTFIGLEMGEQAKFLPQVRAGEILPGRSLFYLPPITLALLLILLSAQWPARRWQTWAVRLLAVAISLLAFPAFEAVGTEAAEWLWRVLMIGGVLLAILLTPLIARLPARTLLVLTVVTALAGALLPVWPFIEVRVALAKFLPQGPAVGMGLWTTVAGHLLVAFAVAGQID
ncbi:MAG TPA: hypothetical protein VK879_10275 [Candidatus Sulfomarinibacteraceae bacterium]|nr:hypothetical protein [Candidatus Sulfomarinibacteraceae bacterium]